MNSTKKALGTFEITSGKMIVSDPCYPRGTWCAGALERVKLGKWKAVVIYSDEGEWGIRVKKLRVKHELARKISGLRRRNVPFDVGVDSGQAGFFDDDHFHSDDNDWYDMCCHSTRRPVMASVIDGGVVSESGYGDGSYDCCYYTDDNGEVVGAVLTFI